MRSVGSELTKRSARGPSRASASVPTPPGNAPTAQVSTTSPVSRTPASITVLTAASEAAQPAFMVDTPMP